jgi:hypothetical protein
MIEIRHDHDYRRFRSCRSGEPKGGLVRCIT